MSTSDQRVRHIGAPFLVFELCHKGSGDEQGVSLVGSIPNREGTLFRHWPSPSGVPSESQFADLDAFVRNLIYNALLVKIGVQQDLGLA